MQVAANVHPAWKVNNVTHPIRRNLETRKWFLLSTTTTTTLTTTATITITFFVLPSRAWTEERVWLTPAFALARLGLVEDSVKKSTIILMHFSNVSFIDHLGWHIYLEQTNFEFFKGLYFIHCQIYLFITKFSMIDHQNFN